MNTLIDKELRNTNICRLPDYCDDTLTISISRGSRNSKDATLGINHYYQIKLKNYVIDPQDNLDLHVQWNNNVIPKDDLMNVEVLQIMGKMVRVSGTGVNSSSTWTGWLPQESFTIEKVIA